MIFSVFVILLLQNLAETAPGQQLFAYERGKCDIAVSEVIEGVVKTGLRQLINPSVNVNQDNILRYDLYTPLNPQRRQQLRAGDINMLKNSNFNAKWPVRISIHGWTGSSRTCSNAAIKDAYLARGNYNVIIMDWSYQSLDFSYYRISKQMPSMANSLKKLLRFLHDNTGVPYERIYLVGHSAGCHIAGLTGKMLRPDRLGAIIALDPAGLTQLALGPMERLAPKDAIYVESIHTDLELLGNPQGNRLSQASFFVNWGRGQPHCPNATATEFDFACDHFSAMYYFAESVRNPKLFGALRCPSLQSALNATCTCNASRCPADAFMGGEPATPKKGIYYLSTLRQVPFGTGDGLVYIQPPIPSTVVKTSPRKRIQYVG